MNDEDPLRVLTLSGCADWRYQPDEEDDSNDLSRARDVRMPAGRGDTGFDGLAHTSIVFDDDDLGTVIHGVSNAAVLCSIMRRLAFVFSFFFFFFVSFSKSDA